MLLAQWWYFWQLTPVQGTPAVVLWMAETITVPCFANERIVSEP